jgi:hypothetical protein
LCYHQKNKTGIEHPVMRRSKGGAMQKADFKKELKNLYNASIKEVSLVEVPPMNFIMIDGAGDPNTAREYREAIEALYSLSYAIKFAVKKAQEVDYGVMPLEGLWWTDNMSQFSPANKDIWKWTAMIMQPIYVSADLFVTVWKEVSKKKELPGLSKARFQSFSEGLSAQIMHIGPYSEEAPQIAKLHSFIKGRGFTFDGVLQKHHEIYLSDFRRTDPGKLKTIIRQPMLRIS